MKSTKKLKGPRKRSFLLASGFAYQLTPKTDVSVPAFRILLKLLVFIVFSNDMKLDRRQKKSLILFFYLEIMYYICNK